MSDPPNASHEIRDRIFLFFLKGKRKKNALIVVLSLLHCCGEMLLLMLRRWRGAKCVGAESAEHRSCHPTIFTRYFDLLAVNSPQSPCSLSHSTATSLSPGPLLCGSEHCCRGLFLSGLNRVGWWTSLPSLKRVEEVSGQRWCLVQLHQRRPQGRSRAA